MKELGQIMFGNPSGEFEMKDFETALTDYLFEEIERIYWNTNQDEWDRHEDPKMKDIEFRPYYWGEDKKEMSLPNFKIKGSPQEIRWYKHIGRSQTSAIKWNEKEWRKWFDDALIIIRKNDKNIYYK